MIIEIIKHTPTWVFILFGLLLSLGYSQTKNRKVTLKKVCILPVIMIVLLLFSISSVFGIIPISLIVWFIGGSISLFLGLKLAFPKNIEYNNLEKAFYIPGSWVPMILILTIFSIKYFVGVVVAEHLAIVHQIAFIITISLIYGFLSGIFVSRSIVMLKSKKIIHKS